MTAVTPMMGTDAAPADVRAVYVPPRREGRGWRSSVMVSGLGDVEREMWFDTTVEQPVSADAFALLLRPLCLTRGLSLHIDGPVSVGLWRNLYEYAGMFYTTGAHRKDPKLPPPSMTVSELVPPHPSDADPNAAVVAFSGGVDSALSIVRHTQLLPEDIRYNLKRAVIVHGFDVPIGDTEGFRSLVERVRKIPEDAGIELVEAATNYREFRPDWEMSFGAAVGAALHLVRGDASVGLVPSSDPYSNMWVPWGSAPYSDHLFSSSDFRVVHDGANSSRLRKIVGLSQHPEIVPRLKFCFESRQPEKNCGTCRKCVFTQLVFGISGKILPSVDVVFDRRQLRACLESFSADPYLRVRLFEVVEFAESTSSSDPRLSEVRKWMQPSLVKRLRRRLRQDRRRVIRRVRRQLQRFR